MTVVDNFFRILPSMAAAVSILWMGFQWYHSTPMKAWRTRRKVQAIASSARKFVIWCNAMLLTALSFASDIAQVLNTYLPSLTPYLPADVHKWVGLAAVVLNIVHALYRRRMNGKTQDQIRSN